MKNEDNHVTVTEADFAIQVRLVKDMSKDNIEQGVGVIRRATLHA